MRRQLIAFLPERFSGTYFEPFLGAASLFLAIRPKTAVVADANTHLIGAYEAIRDRPSEVAAHLGSLAEEDSEDQYYKIRSCYNNSGESPLQAARFLYLNRTCFNGIFRVNKRGEFNVPYGFKKRPRFPTLLEIHRFAKALAAADMFNCDYSQAVVTAGRGDFIYLDPPYPALNGTANFAHYTMDRFPTTEQEKLAQLVRTLDSRGCLLMISNADTPLIRRLYRGFHLNALSATRYVTCKAKKHRVRELIITNYRPTL